MWKGPARSAVARLCLSVPLRPPLARGIAAVLLASTALLWVSSYWVCHDLSWSIGGTTLQISVACSRGVFTASYVSFAELDYPNGLNYRRGYYPRNEVATLGVRVYASGFPPVRPVPPTPHPTRRGPHPAINYSVGGRLTWGFASVAGWLPTLSWLSAWAWLAVRRRPVGPGFQCLPSVPSLGARA